MITPVPASVAMCPVVWGADVSAANRSLIGGVFQWRPGFFQDLRDGGIRFCYFKDTEGLHQDPSFRDGLAMANTAGLLTGAYSFARPDADPKDEAEFFLQTVRGLPLDLRPVLDIELLNKRTAAETLTWCRGWLDLVPNAIVYTGPGFWLSLGPMARDPYWKRFPLWVAHYGASRPMIPAPWDDYLMWQLAGNALPGTAPGQIGQISPIDVNVFRGFYDDFRRAHGLDVALP